VRSYGQGVVHLNRDGRRVTGTGLNSRRNVR
jgi:hypothetical protein